ncbi:MAG: hypothetical protein ACI37O_01860, partial [Candidatus Avelusimicrobium sp.]|uniref:hypothetical protein n=1 Tax=Candidatus Avelusimicrobium sp. TaxID=3048833 RepID=UPI003EFBAFC5
YVKGPPNLIYPHVIKKKKRVNPLAGGRRAGLDQSLVIDGSYQLGGNNTRGIRLSARPGHHAYLIT